MATNGSKPLVLRSLTSQFKIYFPYDLKEQLGQESTNAHLSCGTQF